MNNLEMATVDDLLGELEKRFDATLVVLTAKDGEGGETTRMTCTGGLNAVVGMAYRALDEYARDAHKGMRNVR